MSVDFHVLLGDKASEEAVEDRLLVRFTNCSCAAQETDGHNQSLSKDAGVTH